jgi:hypothetical protein
MRTRVPWLLDKFELSLSNMEWKHITQLWPKYKYPTDVTNIQELNTIEPYIPASFATEVFRSIKKVQVDSCPSSAATNDAQVAVWMRAVHPRGSSYRAGLWNRRNSADPWNRRDQLCKSSVRTDFVVGSTNRAFFSSSIPRTQVQADVEQVDSLLTSIPRRWTFASAPFGTH